MITPDISFRPDPHRAIYILGRIDQDLVRRVTPEILKLQHESRRPISVYIDSPGGDTLHAASILSLLASSNQDWDQPCRLITVVTAQASSAAADLLSAGDYAIAYPDARVLYHGVRTAPATPVTVEIASGLTEWLKTANDRFAMDLARRSNGRFIFRYLLLRTESARQTGAADQASLEPGNVDSFVDLLTERVTAAGANVLAQARTRNQRYQRLLEHMKKSAFRRKRFRDGSRLADLEAEMLKGVIDFARTSNRDPSWTFRDGGGMAQLQDDFLLLREYLDIAQNVHVKAMCDRWGRWFLTAQDAAELNSISDEAEREGRQLEKLTPFLQPLWFFFVALCHALQDGENELTAEDAFWLGLIDEVYGHPALGSLRLIAEYTPDEGGPSASGE